MYIFCVIISLLIATYMVIQLTIKHRDEGPGYQTRSTIAAGFLSLTALGIAVLIKPGAVTVSTPPMPSHFTVDVLSVPGAILVDGGKKTIVLQESGRNLELTQLYSNQLAIWLEMLKQTAGRQAESPPCEDKLSNWPGLYNCPSASKLVHVELKVPPFSFEAGKAKVVLPNKCGSGAPDCVDRAKKYSDWIAGIKKWLGKFSSKQQVVRGLIVLGGTDARDLKEEAKTNQFSNNEQLGSSRAEFICGEISGFPCFPIARGAMNIVYPFLDDTSKEYEKDRQVIVYALMESQLEDSQ